MRIDSDRLNAQLGGIYEKVIVLRETASTNTDARTMISEGNISDSALITAEFQTMGRGRQGKSFLSPEGGLYMTVVMRTELPFDSVVGTTSCAAAAAALAISASCGADCGIKWVNDIYLKGKKLAGILTESVNDYEAMLSRYVIIGIGVNIAHHDFPSEINAISLADAGFDADITRLCASLASEFMKIRENQFDFSRYADEYRSRSIVTGRDITYIRNGEMCTGTATGIDDNGYLLVDRGNETDILSSGEISVRLN